MTGIVAAIGVLLLVVTATLAAASFFPHILAAAMALIAVPIAAFLFALVGVYETLFVLATVAIVACLVHTITDTFRLVRTTGRSTASGAPGSSRI